MLAGRPRKPAVIRESEGNRSKSPIPVEPIPRNKRPTCPRYLSAEARRVWRETCRELEFMNLLYSADRQLLISFCSAAAEMQKASEVVEKEGLIVTGGHGGQIRNPAVMILSKARSEVARMSALLGLSAVGRARLGKIPEKTDGKDELRDFLARRKQRETPDLKVVAGGD